MKCTLCEAELCCAACGHFQKQNEEIDKLKTALWHMTDKFEPFTSKPMGAPGSQARAWQEQQLEAHMRAVELLGFTYPEFRP